MTCWPRRAHRARARTVNADEMLAQLQRLLEAARVKRIPIVLTTTGFEGELKDAAFRAGEGATPGLAGRPRLLIP